MEFKSLLESSTNSQRQYKCMYCSKSYTRSKLVDHIDEKHEDLIPNGYSASRLVFNMINKKDHGTCTICGKESPWNEDKGRYDRICSNPDCKKKYIKMTEERLMKARGVTKQDLLNDPDFQEKMLENRGISGKYKFQDGTYKTYTGTYEKKFLEFLDVFLHIDPVDIYSPGPVIEYEYEGKKHKWITDFYYEPYNLVFDIKDGGDNPNNRSMVHYRAKQIEKEKAIKKLNKYNYIRLTNNNFEQLVLLMMELKELYLDNNKEDTHIIRINEYSLIMEEETIKDNGDLYLLRYNIDEKAMVENTIPSNFIILDIHSAKSKKYIKQDSFLDKMVQNNNFPMYNGEIIIDTNKDAIAGRVLVGNKKSGSEGFINSLLVYSEYRNNGLGSKLLDDAVKKYKGVDLTVKKTNINAIRMYKKYGFVFLEYKNMDKDDTYWMKLKSKLTKQDKVINIYIRESLGYSVAITESKEYDSYHDQLYLVEYSIKEMSTEERNKLPDSAFGIPSKRKYPLDTEAHTRSAIKFFNYCDEEDEKELAENIIKAMKKFNIIDIKISDKNRFSKYYNSVEESGLKSDIDKNFAPKGHISLSSLHRIKITETICKKLSSKYKHLKHLRVQDNTLGYFFMKDSSSDEIVSTIMVETKSDGTKWIQALEINSRYQGYGLGKQTLNYACKTMGAKYLSVYKDNKIALKMYKKYGFRIYNETQYMYMMTIDNSKKEFALCNESINEAYIKNEQDIYYNKDKFDSGEINLCFITGLSGSGKSTMGHKIEKDNVDCIELDDLLLIKDRFSMDNLKEYSDLIYSFFNSKGKKWYMGYNDLMKLPKEDPYEDQLFIDFINYAISYSKSHKNKKYVLEGVWIFKYMKPEQLKNFAVYIKGTSMIVSKIRAAKRDSRDGKTKFERTKAFAKGIFRNLKWYIIDEKQVQKFRDYYSKLVGENNISESSKKILNDKGEQVPEKCPKCGADVKIYIKGEPVYLCSNEKCAKYFGTVPFVKEDTIEEFPYIIKESNEGNKHPIFIVLSYTYTAFGKIVKNITHAEYSHAAISLDPGLHRMFSFNTNNNVNEKGGFSIEDIDNYANSTGESYILINTVFVNDNQYNIITNYINDYQKNIKNTKYNYSNLFKILMNKSIDDTGSMQMVCSEFVYSIFKLINQDLLNKSSNLVTPQDLAEMKDKRVYTIYKGTIKDYKVKKIEKKLDKLYNSALILGENFISEDTAATNVMVGTATPIYVNRMQNMAFNKKENKKYAICKQFMTDLVLLDDDEVESLEDFMEYATDIKMYRIGDSITESTMNDYTEVYPYSNTLTDIRESFESTLLDGYNQSGIGSVPIFTLNESMENTNIRYYRDLDGVFIKNIDTGFRSKSFDDEKDITAELKQLVSKSAI